MPPKLDSKRLPKNTIVVDEISKWLAGALPKGTPLPLQEQLNKLGDELKILLNRASNDELRRTKKVGGNVLKDVSPGEEIERLVQNVVIAAIALEEFAGPVLKTKRKDIYLAEFARNIRAVRTLHLPSKSVPSGRGRPLMPWKLAGRKFAEAVKRVLKESNIRGPASLSNPASVPVIVATEAIKWAYGVRLTPEGFVTALRGRFRRKHRYR